MIATIDLSLSFLELCTSSLRHHWSRSPRLSRRDRPPLVRWPAIGDPHDTPPTPRTSPTARGHTKGPKTQLEEAARSNQVPDGFIVVLSAEHECQRHDGWSRPSPVSWR